MKKFLFTLICFIGSFSLLHAQQPTQGAQPDANGPQFKWINGDTHDFGKVPEGPQAKYVFEFENVGKQPLIIFEANPSCGCTQPTFDKQPILPGHKGKIDVAYNTQGRPNNFNKEIYVKSNASKTPVTLYIKGNVIPASNQPPVPAGAK